MSDTAAKHKILLLDDDPGVLEMYQQMLLQLPSHPEVHIATSGARAMAMLESEPFNVLVSDLNMPKMDGLQVIAIVRRKHPQLRTIVLTGVADEQMRARAYGMGIDLYLEKPGNSKEINFLMDCIESLLDTGKSGGFRGVQSKSLVDLIQLECLSGSSSALKIINGKLEGTIWIQNGELIDAATEDAQGEDAFKRILSWRAGSFEILPLETQRVRTINTSYQGLLLNSVQEIDEIEGLSLGAELPAHEGADITDTQFFQKSGLGRIQGVEFALKISRDRSIAVQKWGLENAEPLTEWVRKTLAEWEALGEAQEFGEARMFEARNSQQQIHISIQPAYIVAIGMLPGLSREKAEQNVNKVLERWAS